MKDELQRLEEWISSERLKYTITNFETDQKKLDEIERQQVLLEVQMQIVRFKQELMNEQIESWSKKIDIGISGSTHTIGNQTIMIGSTNDTPEKYMHISTEQRKLFDEVKQNKIAKS